MQDSAYLIINRNSIVGTRKGSPTLKPGEFAVRLNVSVPEAAFRAFYPEVNLSINEQHLLRPGIDVEVEPIHSEDDTQHDSE